jgi:hypothetical protein
VGYWDRPYCIIHTKMKSEMFWKYVVIINRVQIMDWISMAQDNVQRRALLGKAMKLRTQLDAGDFLNSWVTKNDSYP